MLKEVAPSQILFFEDTHLVSYNDNPITDSET